MNNTATLSQTNTYGIEKNGISLTAELLMGNLNGSGKKVKVIELNFVDPKGNVQISRYCGGFEIHARAFMANGVKSLRREDGRTYVPNRLDYYDKFGQELRAQIPSEWHSVLGLWLKRPMYSLRQ